MERWGVSLAGGWDGKGWVVVTHHDAGIVGEDIQTLLLAQEFLRARLDAREVREIELQEFQLAFGSGCVRFDVREPFVGFCLRAAGDVDGAVGGVEVFAELFAHACVAAGYDEDAAGLIGQVFFGEGWRGDEEALAEGVEVEGHYCSDSLVVGCWYGIGGVLLS